MAKIIMTNKRLIELLWYIVNECKSIYMYACYGWQVNDHTISVKSKQNLNGWYTKAHINGLKEVANEEQPYWGFDCVNLLKGVLWGWTGDTSKIYGGAVYGTNGVPDTNANGMITFCKNVSTNFANIMPGEGLWMEGHWGIYVGDGLAIECTGRWKNGVQVTSVWNLGKKEGYNGRYWTKHGIIPWIAYEQIDDHITPEKIELGSRTIKKGTQGSDVVELQKDLMKLGYTLPKYGADGDCGKETVNAIKMFQEDSGLEADGVFGKETYNALKRALNRIEALETPKEQTYTVILHGVSKADSETLTAHWPNSEVKEE